MSRPLQEFLASFVVPLLGGGKAAVARPLRPRELEQWAGSTSLLSDSDLLYVRWRRAEQLVAEPDLAPPDEQELALWMGLHNLLVFDHPDRPRVWARNATWRRLEGATRTLLSLPMPRDVGETVARHVSIGALISLLRTDLILVTAAGEQRLSGRAELLAGALGRVGRHEVRTETVAWIEQPHGPETERLLEDALRTSPLTCLLRPDLAPPGWSPLHCTALLRTRAYARSVCHGWAAAKDWTRVGGAVMSALLRSLPGMGGDTASASATLPGARLALVGAVAPTGPDDLGALLGALIHLHVLKVLELDTRVGVALGSRDPGVMAFLALPLLLPWLQGTLGSPVGQQGTDGFEIGLARRWNEYLDHLEELIPRAAVENLLAGLVPRVVQPS